jgi:hypothetical protein
MRCGRRDRVYCILGLAAPYAFPPTFGIRETKRIDERFELSEAAILGSSLATRLSSASRLDSGVAVRTSGRVVGERSECFPGKTVHQFVPTL